MNKKIKLLILERSEKEIKHILKELKNYGYNPEYRLLGTFKDFSANIKKGSWDAIIASKELKSINTEDALKLIKSRNLDIPFIGILVKENVRMSKRYNQARIEFSK